MNGSKDWLCSQCGEWHSDHKSNEQVTEIERLQEQVRNRDYALDKVQEKHEAEIERLQADVSWWENQFGDTQTEVERLRAVESAARLLVADVRNRHPEQELYCPFMRALDTALEQARKK
jgi:hypothetical protein